MSHRFSEYDARELEQAGAELVDLFRRLWAVSEIGTEQWTELVLDFFAARAVSGALVEARASRLSSEVSQFRAELPARHTYGEFASFDMLHSNNPGPNEYSSKDEYWNALLARPFEVFLALESEWERGTREVTRAEVLNDAVKLAMVRARSKVMVFGARAADDAATLFSDIKQLRLVARDDSPWLVVGLPSGVQSPSHSVLS